MKITKKNLRKIIRETISETTAGPPISGEQAMQMGGDRGGPPRNEGARMAEEVVDAIKNGSPGVDYKRGTDEIYIMTGAAEGITVKVLRRGR
tara:strand:- start:357 stop:632 length:276 start_codon:yes stop_codon:yes gene_type:complete